MQNEQQNDPDRLTELLQAVPVPVADPGFYDRVTAHAARNHGRYSSTGSHRVRWFAAGVSGAVAAGLVALVVGGWVGSSAALRDAGELPSVSIRVDVPRTIKLVFATTEALDHATLTVFLPAGVELEGFPGQQQISWETSLVTGRNLLPLRLHALTPVHGELLAHLQHDSRDRTFKVRLSAG